MTEQQYEDLAGTMDQLSWVVAHRTGVLTHFTISRKERYGKLSAFVETNAITPKIPPFSLMVSEFRMGSGGSFDFMETSPGNETAWFNLHVSYHHYGGGSNGHQAHDPDTGAAMVCEYTPGENGGWMIRSYL